MPVSFSQSRRKPPQIPDRGPHEVKGSHRVMKGPICTVSRKNENVFCNILYKTPAILMKFSTLFPE